VSIQNLRQTSQDNAAFGFRPFTTKCTPITVSVSHIPASLICSTRFVICGTQPFYCRNAELHCLCDFVLVILGRMIFISHYTRALTLSRLPSPLTQTPCALTVYILRHPSRQSSCSLSSTSRISTFRGHSFSHAESGPESSESNFDSRDVVWRPTDSSLTLTATQGSGDAITLLLLTLSLA